MAGFLLRPVRSRAPFALVAAGCLVLAAGAAVSATSPAAAPSPAAASSPAAATGDPATPLADLPPTQASRYSGAALVHVGGGCSGVLIAPHAGAVPAAAPAYVLTNGHCIDFLPPTAVRRDIDATGTVTFGWPGSDVEEVVSVRAIPWASMKTTDLAILELDTTMGELRRAGIRALPLAPVAAPPGSRVAIVGAPTPVHGAERQLLVAVCTLGPAHALVEDQWSWSGFPSNDCADVRPGSSGSPVLDLATDHVVGLVNTGTDGSSDRSDCMRDRPCEVGPGAQVQSVEDTNYGPVVAGLDACFDAGWRFTGPGGDCPLDPGIGVEVTGATTVTNPDVVPPTGRAPRTTWGAQLTPTDPGITHYRVKTGRLGIVDCRDAEGYGPPRALAEAPVVDLPLPQAEGRYQLCLLAGPGPIPDERWQEPRFATVVTAWVDRTPPVPAVELRVDETASGWSVEPVVVPPDLTVLTWKTGPAATTDCADPGGYAVFRHAPRDLVRAAAPLRVCVIGHDDAGNPTPPLDRVLE